FGMSDLAPPFIQVGERSAGRILMPRYKGRHIASHERAPAHREPNAKAWSRDPQFLRFHLLRSSSSTALDRTGASRLHSIAVHHSGEVAAQSHIGTVLF